jgi:hypothetical protein
MSDSKLIGPLPALGMALMTEITASFIVACWIMFTELLPGNALINPLQYKDS